MQENSARQKSLQNWRFQHRFLFFGTILGCNESCYNRGAPRRFFYVQKYSKFVAIYKLLAGLRVLKVLIKTSVGQFDFISWLIYVFCVLKMPGSDFQRIN